MVIQKSVLVFTMLFLTACGYQTSTPMTSSLPIPSETSAPTPTDDRILFNPPIEVELISLKADFNYILAGDTISYLTDYEKNSWKLSYDERVRLDKIYDMGYAYYLLANSKVLLLEFDDDFARIRLLTGQFDKSAGSVGWIRKNNIKSYPQP